MSTLQSIGKFLLDLFSESETDYEGFNHFMWVSAEWMENALLIGLVLFVLLTPKLRKHKRTEDKLIFWECVLIWFPGFYTLILSYVPIEWIYRWPWINYLYLARPVLIELLYMLAILQWLIFVDYCLYRSKDHLRRRYRHSVIPILIVVILDSIIAYIIYTLAFTRTVDICADVLWYVKMAVELCYIATAIYLVRRYSKQSHEPKFLRISAFIVPFLLGNLIRFYDMFFMGLGVVLTYRAVKRRDKYIDHETGFYNGEYLEYLRTFRREKGYFEGYAMSIEAKGNGKAMADLLRELKPAGISIFSLGEERFLLLGETTRESALSMTAMTLKEAAEESEAAFTPKIEIVKNEETM